MNPPSDENKQREDTHSGYQRYLYIAIVAVVLICAVGIATAAQPLVIEDVEDGDTSDWRAGGGLHKLNATSQTQAEGQYSARMEENSETGDSDVWHPMTNRSKPVTIRFWIRTNFTNSGSDEPVWNIENNQTASSNNEIRKIASIKTDGASINWDNGTSQNNANESPNGNQIIYDNFNKDTWYEIRVTNINHTSDTADVAVYSASGVQLGSVDDVEFKDADFEIFGKIAVRNSPHSVNYLDYVTADFVGAKELSGTVRDDETNNPIENATVSILNQTDGSVEATTQTDVQGNYDVEVQNGTYDVKAEKPGYFNQTKSSINLESDNTADFRLTPRSKSLEIETWAWLGHSMERKYEVWFTTVNETTGNEERINVTLDGNTSVRSNNTDAITINPTDALVIASNNQSVNVQTYIEANYTTVDGSVVTTRHNITVANLSVDNIDILPPFRKFEASIAGGLSGDGGFDANPRDKTVMVILIATGIGVAASVVATPFAGVAAIVLVMVSAWVMGITPTGMMLVSLFVGLFVGLNVAENTEINT